MAHIILFEHMNFHGAHKHVVGPESNLNAQDDNFFNDRVSSLVVLEGNWALYGDYKFEGQYPPVLGIGLYPRLDAIGIKNDDISSLQPVMDPQL
jgi:Beta/Gamma crystallin